LATFWELLLNFFFPLQCVTCGRLLAADNKERLCGDCWSRIIYLNRPIDIKLSLERIWSVAVYDGVLRELIHQFKYKEKKYLAHLLGKLLVDFVGVPGRRKIRLYCSHTTGKGQAEEEGLQPGRTFSPGFGRSGK